MATLSRRLAGFAFLAVLLLLVWFVVARYQGRFTPAAMVVVETDNAGNNLHPRAEVKARGVVVGEVRRITSTGDGARLELALRPDQFRLLPADVSAQLLPTTLFGERYVALVLPRRPGPARLAEHAVIQQDRSANAIELERVLADLLPLLQAVQPHKLSVTLTAIAQALDGRGAQLGTTLRDLNAYLTELEPSLPRLNEDISRLVEVVNSYTDAAPDLTDALTHLSVTSRTLVEQQSNLRTLFASVTSAGGDLNSFLLDNRDTIIRLSANSRPTLTVLAKYAPEFPCVLQQLTDTASDMDKALGKGTAEPGLHVRLHVSPSRGEYRPGKDDPVYRDKSGPACYPTPDSLANTPQENAYLNELMAASLGVAPRSLPPWSSLLVGPVFRGKEVTLTP
ncbi:MCE family protein [Actinoplanes sp. NPDC049599]|uniref:MCE family protein n=1 Tax=Actinoplanes sp. NPDC049599 TaxID=3363903 RepID=UPI003799E60E